MKNWIKYKINVRNLILIFLILLLGLLFIEKTKEKVATPYFQLQLQAAKIMQESILAIREGKEEKGIAINTQLDPNKTGLIGEEFTLITTTIGNLSAKRTSTNPDFAALMVKYFNQLHLKQGDIIAVGSSGSFPALFLATLAACQAMNIIPIPIYAIGASEYGATIPEFTFIEMLNILNQKGIMNYRLTAVSLGGNQDDTAGLFLPESKELAEEIAEQSGLTFINTGSLKGNIEERMKIYKELAGDQPIRTFVNIGGASANYGITNNSITFPNGLVLGGVEIPDSPERGLIFDFLAEGIPIIHLLNIRDLALKNGIPIDPMPLPEIGSSEIYYQYDIQKWIILLTIILVSALIFYSKKKE